MINDDTLVMLNRLGIGLNVDLIELYVSTYNSVLPIASGGIDVCKYDALKLSKVLEELKPSSSVVLNKDKSEIIKNTEIYSLITNLDEPEKLIYGPADIDIQNKEKNKFYITDSYRYTLCGAEIHDGIKVLCMYKLGKLYKIYAISSNGVYYNFTEELRHSVPDEIVDLAYMPITELHGTAYQTSSDSIFNNTILDTFYDIKHERKLNSIEIIFDDIFILTDDREVVMDYSTSNKFSKIEFIDGLGLKVVKAGILRDIDKQSFNPAIAQFSKFFTDKGIYRFSVSDNNDYKTTDKMLTYESHYVNSDYVFSGVVNGIEQFGDYTKLLIVHKVCNDNLIISEIPLDDIYILEKNNIHTGSKVEFRVIKDRVVLI